MKNKIIADYPHSIAKIIFKGDLIDNLILLGLIMEFATKEVMLKYGCNHEQAKLFVQDLPNKLVYKDKKSNLTFRYSK